MTTSAAGFFSVACMSTGMPRPLSITVTLLSSCTVTLISSQKPAMASSTELSATSQTRWWRPISPVEPMYIAGRLRTASIPPRTLMEVASYLWPPAGEESFSAMNRASPREMGLGRATPRSSTCNRSSILGKAVARNVLDTFPAATGAASSPCPLAPLARNASPSRDSKGVSGLHPVRFRVLGRTRRSRFSTRLRGRSTAAADLGGTLVLALAGRAATQISSEQSAVQEESLAQEFYRVGAEFTRRFSGGGWNLSSVDSIG